MKDDLARGFLFMGASIARVLPYIECEEFKKAATEAAKANKRKDINNLFILIIFFILNR
jgi:hypothetical protein